ncbi:MAG: Glycerol-3-phosphate dehydrogenase, partial [Dehalococcoidia bacterium]|nr:Glycerol-3-phosphate dehydrogenase [Dehalococcoidia bacterium]
GAIPFGVILGKLLKGVDVRNYGSGKIGTANVTRSLGVRIGLLVLVLDLAKGVAVVVLARAIGVGPLAQALAGIAAVVGHNWSVFIRFGGGRGVTTGLGALYAISPLAGIVAMIAGFLTMAIFRYVSVGSMVGAIVGGLGLIVLTTTDRIQVDYLLYALIRRNRAAPSPVAATGQRTRHMKAAVIGTGSWGTTLAIVLARKGVEVSLWARTAEEAARLSAQRRNLDRLPDHEFPKGLDATPLLDEACKAASLVVVAVPSNSMRENARRLAPYLTPSMLVMSASKGLERDTGKRMSEVIAEEAPAPVRASIAVLSGPNLSKEVADGQPASTVIASASSEVAERGRDMLMSPTFRTYTNLDVIGVEYGGALKNIIAIGAGMSDGLGYGDNAKAAFITRGLAEITRLGVAAGAKPLTFAGLACLGDLIATCASRLSRNYFVGEQLAKGRPLKSILAGMRYIAEGVDTTVAALLLAKRLGVDMPITSYTYKVLFDGMEPERAVVELMSRAPRFEWEGLAFS